MLPKRGTRNGNRGKCMRNRKEIGKQHREWVIKLLIGLRLAPVFHFPISVFILCSLFLVLVASEPADTDVFPVVASLIRVERPEIRLHVSAG